MRRIISVMVVIALVWLMGSFFSALAVDKSRAKFRIYQIKKGDTLSEIAWTLKVSRADLVKWNSEIGIHNIHPGQKIRYLSSQDIIEAVTETIQTGNEVIKETIKSGNDKIFDQVSQLEINLKTTGKEVVENNNRVDKVINRLNHLEKTLIGVFLVLLVAWLFYVIRTRKRCPHQSEETKEKEIELEIKGIKYIYRPQVNAQGRFVSLYANEMGGLLSFEDIVDLRKSIKTSFRKKPILIKQEIEAGRLIRKS